MFENRQPSQITLEIISVRLCILFVLMGLTACQASPTSSIPAASTVLPPTETQPAPFTTQPIAGGPVLLRADITLRKVMEVGANNIRIVRNPVDGDIYLLNPTEGIFRISDISGAASRDKVASIREIKGSATGIAFGPDGTLYAVLNATIDKTKNQVVVRKGVPNDQGRFTWETLASSEPYPLSNTYFDHLYNGVIVSLDGQWIYINGGSRTDHGEVEDNGGAFPNTRDVALTARILRIPTTATELVLPNDEAALTEQGLILARGTRNAYDMAFAPNGDLFAVDNSPDADYPDELNWIREGLHYGFPWRFGTQDNPQRLPDYDPSKDLRLQSGYWAVDHGFYHNDPDFPPPPSQFTDPVVNVGPDAMTYRGDDGQEYDAGKQGKMLSTFTPHISPLGLTFASEPELPAQWRDDGDTFSAFLVSWGAAGGTLSYKGQGLLHLKLTKTADNYEVTTSEIARGFLNPIDTVLIENRLYVLEYGGNGVIWELTFQ
ncbi:MAG TPA: PQQ-dependent sugar dehydrogenase [Anaerolineales bacterium]|nr:PQQ-dependent sugar dehydrogenase [Anaerolineales bacterium]